MRKNQWMFGILSVMFCIMILAASPAQAKAGNVKQSDRNAYRAVFDASYYYETYPDLAAAIGMDDEALLSHFINYGMKEGRSSSAEFNLQAYIQRYEDLQSAFGSDMAAYCRHYTGYGKAEGRNARPDGESTIVEPIELKNTVSGQTKEKESLPVSGDKIGTCTTYYETSVPRAQNVELAAQRINGVVVQPGTSFSFSKAILPRTAANGYVVAPIFISGKVGTGTGGGVCQVSSTLYASMVYSGLPATERHAHSLPVDYLPKGLDATIAGNSLDLKFTNTFSQPLLIQASAGGGVLTVTLVLQ